MGSNTSPGAAYFFCALMIAMDEQVKKRRKRRSVGGVGGGGGGGGREEEGDGSSRTVMKSLPSFVYRGRLAGRVFPFLSGPVRLAYGRAERQEARRPCRAGSRVTSAVYSPRKNHPPATVQGQLPGQVCASTPVHLTAKAAGGYKKKHAGGGVVEPTTISTVWGI